MNKLSLMARSLLAISVLLVGCGAEEADGTGDADAAAVPIGSLQQPDSLRSFDSLPPPDSFPAADFPQDLDPVEAKEDSVAPVANEAFPRPEHVRGIYLNAWGAGSTPWSRITLLLLFKGIKH